MMDIFLKIIQLGIILNILLIVSVSISLLITILSLRSNNSYEYNRIFMYSKTLGKVSIWQTIANIVIPFYGFFIYYRIVNILLVEEHQSMFVKFKLIELETNKFRIFKRRR